MIWNKLCFFVGKNWLSYVLFIVFFLLIEALLHYSSISFGYVMVVLFSAAIATLIFLLAMAAILKRKINKSRKSVGEDPVNIWQVDLSSSITSLDATFLIFASWKIGESIVGINKIVELGNTEELTRIYPFFVLTLIATLYSFMKVLDKTKEYEGASIKYAEKKSPIEALSAKERRKNSATEFFITLIFMVVIPCALGYLYS